MKVGFVALVLSAALLGLSPGAKPQARGRGGSTALVAKPVGADTLCRLTVGPMPAVPGRPAGLCGLSSGVVLQRTWPKTRLSAGVTAVGLVPSSSDTAGPLHRMPVFAALFATRSALQQKLDSTVTINEEDIRREMQFGAKEKITSIVAGALFGFIIGGGMGALIFDGEGIGAVGAVLFGGTIGLLVGPPVNYLIIRELARREAIKRLKERRRAQKD